LVMRLGVKGTLAPLRLMTKSIPFIISLLF
jgi:hypothetical protein